MSKTLDEIAQELKNNNKKVQLIYAFNGTGKTRLSKTFKQLIVPNPDELARNKILYYNAFTEDLFYWNNDLNEDREPKLKIQPNSFTNWVLKEQAQDQNVITYFQRYSNEKLTPRFDSNFNEVTFSFTKGNDEIEDNIKISKGEESNFIWCIFYSLLDQVIAELNILEEDERSTQDFNNLEYIFIDDPVSSLDENHLISLAVDLSQLVKKSQSGVKFIITTHNPLFYNVLFNEFRKENSKKYRLEKLENYKYNLLEQCDDSPFAYQLHLKNKIEELFKIEKNMDNLILSNEDEIKEELEKIKTGLSIKELKRSCKKLNNTLIFRDYFISIHKKDQKFTLKFYKEKNIDEVEIEKYYFNWIRNILEKLSTFLGYDEFKNTLPKGNNGEADAYMNRIVNLSSHSKHAAEENIFLSSNDKKVLKGLITHLNEHFKFKSKFMKLSDFIS